MTVSPTPAEIVAHLDQYIIGQQKAKRAVAIAMRNRWRRQQTPAEIRADIIPNNIILIGPTGVGKTEIARRLASLSAAPFLKVEASKFTEVGYVGRDVESMIRDLTDIGVALVKAEKSRAIEPLAQQQTADRLADLLMKSEDAGAQLANKPLAKVTAELVAGRYDHLLVEIDAPQLNSPSLEIFSPMGMEELTMNVQEILGGLLPRRTKRRRVTIQQARRILLAEEIDKLLDLDEVTAEGVRRVQESGILFIDEIDKIVGSGSGTGPDVSREGVQRDILPIVEGSAVTTRYGMIRTDHILFVAAGAFHGSSPSDLIPELQGRFPIRVELDALEADDLEQILTKPRGSLLSQYKALLAAEGVTLEMSTGAVRAVAELAAQVNSQSENIGARRLQTIMATLLEEPLFAPPRKKKHVTLSETVVRKKLADLVDEQDVRKYIL